MKPIAVDVVSNNQLSHDVVNTAIKRHTEASCHVTNMAATGRRTLQAASTCDVTIAAVCVSVPGGCGAAPKYTEQNRCD